MKKLIAITILFILLSTAVFLFNKNMEISRYQSPNGKYELIIKRELQFFGSTMPGDGGFGSRTVKVILKNAAGKTIGSTSNGKEECTPILDSIEVDWDFENNWVWYARGKAIDLKTGKIEC